MGVCVCVLLRINMMSKMPKKKSFSLQRFSITLLGSTLFLFDRFSWNFTLEELFLKISIHFNFHYNVTRIMGN
jgi:hypothetical protein